MVLIGILAAYAAPKFSGRGGYSEMTVRQDLKQSLRYAQQLAMSRTDRTIALVTGAHSIDVKDVGLNVSVSSDYAKNISADVTLDALTLTFDRFGSAGNATTQINITGSVQTLKVCVQGITGYAQDC
jgi:MSHA pilin protein MshC